MEELTPDLLKNYQMLRIPIHDLHEAAELLSNKMMQIDAETNGFVSFLIETIETLKRCSKPMGGKTKKKGKRRMILL